HMGLFGKKKAESLKTLTEKEIQNKLYGRFRTESSAAVEETFSPPNPALRHKPLPKSSSEPDLFRKPASQPVYQQPVTSFNTPVAKTPYDTPQPVGSTF